MSKAAIAEFMAHLIIADKHIHSDQIIMLQDFIDSHALSAHQKEIFAVLEGKGDKHFPQLLNKLKQLDREDEEILIQHAAAIVGFNRHFAKEEKIALANLCKATDIDPKRFVKAIKNIIDEATKARNEKTSSDRPLENFGTLSLKVRRFFARGAKREYLTSKIKENILSGPEYSNAIRVTDEVAEVDCRLVESQLKECIEALDQTRKQVIKKLFQVKPKSKNPSEEENNFYDFLKELSVNLDTRVRKSSDETKELFDKKQRAKSAFTIALMGRTKAGKSTLHYILTGGGKDFIGVGAERTTRFNRVYEWEHLRIIDTPGVGAAEAGGRTDEEIALSIVDIADVICYVVTNDSVQEVEFEFFSKIRYSNKPILIVLNYKENLLSPPPKFKTFLKNPLYWHTRKDEHNLQGTRNRIKSGVNKYYNVNEDSKDSFVKIIPVHLMAAKLAKEGRYKKDWETLNAGSRMSEFFNEIRENVIGFGKLRKSQTLLDGTAYSLNKMYQEVYTQRQSSQRHADDIEAKLEQLLRQVKERIQKNRESFLRSLAAIIENERSSASDFASDNYTLKRKQIENHWNEEAKRISKEVQESLEKKVYSIASEVQSYVTEAVDDISIGINRKFNSDFGDYSTMNTRRLTSVLGSLISTGGSAALIIIGSISNPAGWIAIGVVAAGAIIGLISGFMTSKEEKKRKAITHMTQQINKSLGEMELKYKKYADGIFNKLQEEIEKAIEGTLQRVAGQYRSSGDLLSLYIDKLSSAIDKLNTQFAIRIIEFSTGEVLLEQLSDDKYFSVKRFFEESIEISTYISVHPDDLKRVKEALALKENITINKIAGEQV